MSTTAMHLQNQHFKGNWKKIQSFYNPPRLSVKDTHIKFNECSLVYMKGVVCVYMRGVCVCTWRGGVCVHEGVVCVYMKGWCVCVYMKGWCVCTWRDGVCVHEGVVCVYMKGWCVCTWRGWCVCTCMINFIIISKIQGDTQKKLLYVWTQLKKNNIFCDWAFKIEKVAGSLCVLNKNCCHRSLRPKIKRLLSHLWLLLFLGRLVQRNINQSDACGEAVNCSPIEDLNFFEIIDLFRTRPTSWFLEAMTTPLLSRNRFNRTTVLAITFKD